MTDRDSFLATIRGRLAGGLPTNPLRPVEPHAGATADIAYSADLTDLPAAFAAAARRAGAEVVDLDGGREDLQVLLDRLRGEDGVGTAVVSNDPETADVGPLLADLGIDRLPIGDIDAAAGADLGITGAVCGIALTGSVVVDSGRAGTRLASLLPPIHLALLDPGRLVATPGVFLRTLTVPLPSNLVVVTGPSRSADIELQLTPGVHGPRRVVIGLLPAH